MIRTWRNILNTLIVSEIQSEYQPNIDVIKKLEYEENMIPIKVNPIKMIIERKNTASPPCSTLDSSTTKSANTNTGRKVEAYDKNTFTIPSKLADAGLKMNPASRESTMTNIKFAKINKPIFKTFALNTPNRETGLNRVIFIVLD
jgi:hypothetical protein